MAELLIARDNVLDKQQQVYAAILAGDSVLANRNLADALEAARHDLQITSSSVRLRDAFTAATLQALDEDLAATRRAHAEDRLFVAERCAAVASGGYLFGYVFAIFMAVSRTKPAV